MISQTSIQIFSCTLTFQCRVWLPPPSEVVPRGGIPSHKGPGTHSHTSWSWLLHETPHWQVSGCVLQQPLSSGMPCQGRGHSLIFPQSKSTGDSYWAETHSAKASPSHQGFSSVLADCLSRQENSSQERRPFIMRFALLFESSEAKLSAFEFCLVISVPQCYCHGCIPVQLESPSSLYLPLFAWRERFSTNLTLLRAPAFS